MGKDARLAGLGQRIRRARLSTGLNQKDFSKVGGVSVVTQQQYEAGNTAPTATYFYALENAGIDSAELLTGIPSSGDLNPVDRQTLEMLNELSQNDRAVVFSLLCVLTDHVVGIDDLAVQLKQAQGQRDFAERFMKSTLHDKPKDFGGFSGENE